MDLKKKIGMAPGDLNPLKTREDMVRYINFKLVAMGLPAFSNEQFTNEGSISDKYIMNLFEDIIDDYKEKTRLLSDQLCPADKRILGFLRDYLKDADAGVKIELPKDTFILDQYGLARELSLPPDRNDFFNDWISSYRLEQGILHNPKNDRRTTKGVFHICAGGLPVPADKKEVPKITFARLLHHAVNPPEDMLKLPYTSSQKDSANCFVSLLVKPIVSPSVDGVIQEKRMEVRYFAPGSCVSSLDFIESIFGNEGDPNLVKNDLALDFDKWSGTTGCIVLAPHLISLKKKDLGLPHVDKATKREIADGMAWKEEDELYNDGQPFKLSCRDERGVVVTIIADNYFGYSKKEIKTQLGYSANLIGLCEEEHAGGTIAFPRLNLGEYFAAKSSEADNAGYSFEDVKRNYSYVMDVTEEGYGIDKKYKNIVYVPEDTEFDLAKGKVSWSAAGKSQSIKLQPDKIYILPNGYKVHMERHPNAPAWKLIGTAAEGTFCHKPCTVSGGGKSEISKALENSIIYGNLYINDLQKDLDLVEEIINRDYKNRWKDDPKRTRPSRTILSTERSLGSVIKLLTPSSHYVAEFNAWLDSIPNYIKSLVFLVKRFYMPEWGKDWRSHFSVDVINGKPGHELNFNNRKVRPSYLRVGFHEGGAWCIYKLRMDFMWAAKIQTEDDISSSVTLPASGIEYLNPMYKNKSVKFVTNCEYRLFQRPDDAIIRGYDKQAEADITSNGVFISNFEPLKFEYAQELIEDAVKFDLYTDPVKTFIKRIADKYKSGEDGYFVVPSHPRMVNGEPSKNPRYLQTRLDFFNPIDTYLAEVGVRMNRKIPLGKPVHFPVNSVLPGRRNNPPDKKNNYRPLCVYNPIHYQELPELFMDYTCSLTGKSPSTTGAGSEGALTKGPFNMLTPTSDLNNALLSYILSGYHGYSSAAGHIGPDMRVDHDVSMLVPEIWCRLSEDERDPHKLIKEGCLEKCEDFEYKGQKVLASRLGYRITDMFLYSYLGRVFDEPQAVFPERVLRPELQSMEDFVDGVNNIVEAQKKCAIAFFDDGSIESAIPPLKAILNIMAYGSYEGKSADHPDVRKLFDYDYVVSSTWYRERLILKQKKDAELLKKQIKYYEEFINNPVNKLLTSDKRMEERMNKAKEMLVKIESPAYVESLVGTIGLDPLFVK